MRLICRSCIQPVPGTILLLFSLTGCSGPEKPVTKEEALDFAKKVEISIGNKEEAFLNEAMDTKLLLKRADLPSNSDSRGFRQGFSSSMKMGTAIVTGLSTEGSYSFIKEYEKDKVRHLLFRMYDDGKLNYHDMELTSTGGKCRVADIYMYITGEKLSETIHNFYLQVADEINQPVKTDDSTSWLKRIPDLRSLIQSKKYKEAMDLYKEIPSKLRSGKILQIMHIMICSGLSDEEYTTAIDEYRRNFPNEPNTALLMIDGYVLHKEYDRALMAVNELDKQIDKDPFLDYYRYLCYNLLQQKDKSKECIERVVKNMPDFAKGLLELIANCLEDHQFDRAGPLVKKYKSRRGFDQSSLTILLYRYPDFKE